MKITLAIFFAALLVGCTTGEKMGRMSPGMSKAEVVALLGRPDGFRVIEHYEVYQYSNRRVSGWANDKADYNVIFENERVVEYGAGEVRPGPQPGTVFIFPLRGF